MKYWEGDRPSLASKKGVNIAKLAEGSDTLSEEDVQAIVDLLNHIQKGGKRLSEKDEYEWKTCGILKQGHYLGEERACIDLFFSENDDDATDMDWKLAIMLKKRMLRCVPDVNGEFKFFTNESYEEHLTTLGEQTQ